MGKRKNKRKGPSMLVCGLVALAVMLIGAFVAATVSAVQLAKAYADAHAVPILDGLKAVADGTAADEAAGTAGAVEGAAESEAAAGGGLLVDTAEAAVELAASYSPAGYLAAWWYGE